MADRKIIHLHKDGEDYYFGSVSAIFSVFTKEDIGVSYGSLRNYAISPDKPYSNKHVTIKEGVLISAKGNRGIRAKGEGDTWKNIKAIIVDFDSTLFETSASRELRAVKGSDKDWDAIYACIPQFRLYDGWKKVLKHMQERGISLAIVSAAKAELIEKTLTHFGIECDAIVGYQRYIKKPSPRLMEMALKKLNLRPDEVIYIGDSKEDEEMSRNSGVQFFGALWDSADRDYLVSCASTLSRPEEIIGKLLK